MFYVAFYSMSDIVKAWLVITYISWLIVIILYGKFFWVGMKQRESCQERLPRNDSFGSVQHNFNSQVDRWEVAGFLLYFRPFR